jgi:hypothetical protein
MPPLKVDEQEAPAVDEAETGVVRLTQVRVLPAHLRPPRGELRPDEGAEHGDDAAASQAPRMSAGVCTSRATSAGFMKIPEPTMPPITTSVASMGRGGRASEASAQGPAQRGTAPRIGNAAHS